VRRIQRRAEEERVMVLELKKPELTELKPRIAVIGVGGAGGNAVNNMITAGLTGVDFIVANTDAQALIGSSAETRIQLGLNVTQGLGAGSRPEIGHAAAEESLQQIDEALDGAHMCFITAGMGGGTGTGAAPVVARAAREKGILTVGVVTKPFAFEGARRGRSAEEGIAELQKHVDTLIIIPNQNLFRIATPQTTFREAFAMADEVLHAGVRGITDLMVMPGLINLDFADVRTVMSEMGKAMMGTGEADGPDRARMAAQAAIANPLLDEVSMRGARGVIINITGGMDLTLFEVDEAANLIRELVDPDANIIYGSAFDDSMEGRMRVSVVATGIDAAASLAAQPQAQPVSRAMPGVAATPQIGGSFHTQAPRQLRVTVNAQADPVRPAAASTPAPTMPEPEPVMEASVDPLPSIEDVLNLKPEDAVHEGAVATPVAPAVAAFAEPAAPLAEPIVDEVERPLVAPMRPVVERTEQRPLSLFERMTGGFRVAGGKDVEPARDAGQPQAAPRADDDPLDIPTFLRRQAN